MKIIAITGGIASGKNFISDIFAKMGAEIFDADKIVHDLFLNDQDLIAKIAQEFASAVNDGAISRQVLGEIVFNDYEKLKILEKIIHPKIRTFYQNYLTNKIHDKTKLIVLNVPLILESGGYEYNYLVAIKCQKELRLKRFLERVINKNYSNQIVDDEVLNNLKFRFEKICKLQLSDDERLSKADFVIDNNLELIEVERQVSDILTKIL